MSRQADPSQFMGKTWIFGVQAIIFGFLGAFSLALGPPYLFGLMNKANGDPATDAGVALTSLSLPFLLVCALGVYNIRARRRPLLRLCREGIEVTLIGESWLDRIPLIPGLIRIAWLILSTQGFRKRVVRIPWEFFQDAWVSGPPMAHRLTIVATTAISTAAGLPKGSHVADQLVLPEVMFEAPPGRIAEAIQSSANDPASREHLASWHETRTARG